MHSKFQKWLPLVVVLVAALVYSCGDSKLDVSTGGDSSNDANENVVIEFVGSDGIIIIEGCPVPPAQIPNEADTDRDGIIDKCDNFMVKRDDGAYAYAGSGYYYGSGVWGESSDAVFTLENWQESPMDVSLSITGSDASNFIIREDVMATIPACNYADLPCPSDQFTVKLVASDRNSKTASIQFAINGKNYSLSLDGSTITCEGSSWYCERKFNEMSWPATHNSMANTTDMNGLINFIAKNHDDSMEQQINNGIRGFMLDNYWEDNIHKLCHGPCWLGFLNWVTQNIIYANYLATHPDAIITYILQDGENESQVNDAIMNSGLGNFLFSWTGYLGSKNSPGANMEQWPPLGWLVSNNRRLIVITSKGTSNHDWYLNEKTYGWQNEYDDPGMNCGNGSSGTNARGVSDEPSYVFVMNHFKTGLTGGGDKGWATSNNKWQTLYNHGKDCWDEPNNPHQIIPSFLTVDYYEQPSRSDILIAAAKLNDDACPLSPADYDNGRPCATILSFNEGRGSSLATASDEDFYRFNVTSAGNHTITTYAGDGKQANCDTDTVVTLYDRNGLTVLGTDDNSGSGSCSLLTQNITNTGDHNFKVTGAAGNYTVLVTPP